MYDDPTEGGEEGRICIHEIKLGDAADGVRVVLAGWLLAEMDPTTKGPVIGRRMRKTRAATRIICKLNSY